MEGADGTADFLVSNWQQQQEGYISPNYEHVENSAKQESQGSFGTGSFTTNTFNARLVGSNGMNILKYI